jgi:hypothetical protein
MCCVSNVPLVKIKAPTAAEVCAQFDLRQAQPLLREVMPPRAFLDALLANKQYLAGIDFLSHALAPRDAVWWGCLCLQHALGNNFPEPDKAACKAAIRWVFAPTDENRAAAKPPADAAGPSSPAGGLASAASLTGGSIAPPKAPPMPPSPFAPAKAVAAAIKLATTKADPPRIAETQKLYVELGIALAEGRFSHAEMRGVTATRA